MKIIKFRLCGYSDIFNQVIIGGSILRVDIKILRYDLDYIDLYIGQYSYKDIDFI